MKDKMLAFILLIKSHAKAGYCWNGGILDVQSQDLTLMRVSKEPRIGMGFDMHNYVSI